MHVAAVQFDNPSVTIAYDVDANAAVREHMRVFAEASKEAHLVAGAHISFPGIGHLRRVDAKTYRFFPLNYSALK